MVSALNSSADQSIEYSTYEPEDPVLPRPAPAAAPAQTRTVVSGYSGTGNPTTQQAAFDPTVHQKRVKKCSNILVCFGWLLIICGGINIVVNALSMFFVGGMTSFSYPDVDGQMMSYTISQNTWLMFAVFKIVCGALTLMQGKAIHKVFRPILKEYRDAESGVTQGIVMDKRRSKIMARLKRKIWKITFAMSVVMFMSIVYYSNFQGEMIDQYIDQKYEYIALNNNTDLNNQTDN
jgi:hypothetical protein